MQITIPTQDTKKFTKPSKGEVYGNIWSTKNMDFDSNRGKVRLSERLYRLYDDGDDADLEVPVKFIRSNIGGTDRWWALTQGGASAVDDGLLFKTTDTDPLVGWTQDASTDTPTDCVDDMEIFGQDGGQDRLIIARDTDLAFGMANTGLNSPTTEKAVDGQVAWTTAENAYTSDDVYATANTDQKHIWYTFQKDATSIIDLIPVGATIVGIEVIIEAKCSAAGKNLQVCLTKNANDEAGSHKHTSTLVYSDTIYTLGDSANLWGTTWERADFGVNFGVKILPSSIDSFTYSIDHIQVRVYFAPDIRILPNWWTGATYLNQVALTATNPHPLHQFINLLMVADGNVLHTIDDSLVVVHSRITLPKEYQIIWIEDDGFRVYLGTRHIRGGEALVFPWDGTNTTYDTPLSVNDSISLAGRVDAEGVMHIVNGKGQLMAYNGQDFAEVAAFPIAENDLLRWAPDQARGQRVHPNGITLIDGKINILIDARDSNGNLIENMHSGIWEYDKEVGLYHKYSLGQYDGETNNEWGNSRLIVPGALVETREDKGKILAGSELYINAGTTKLETIMTLSSDTNQRGYFITPQIHATSIRAFWQRLNLAFKKFENSTDRIIVKYRTEKDKNFIGTNGIANSFTITWTDTDTFTVSSTVLDNAEVRDEIEITTGKGAGACAHIASMSGTTPNYTINLDETIPNVAGTGYARIQNWTKLGEISDNSSQKTLFKIIKRSKWIQFKVEMRGGQMSPELEELLLEFNTSKK